MFEAFYEFQQTPFTRQTPSQDLFRSENLDEVLGRLHYASSRQWFAVVTGDCGTGKTTAIRCFKDELDPAAYQLMYLSDSKLTPRHFYKGLLEQLGSESAFYRGDAKRLLHREIELMVGIQKRRPVVVVDEAHLLDREMLEELRFLLNFKMDALSPMALILVGQNELWDRLGRQAYTAIRQRIDIQCKLEHYDRAQTEAYIRKQLQDAGYEAEIFTEKSFDEIYRYSAGSARLINKICTHALLFGAQTKKRLIDDHSLKVVIDGEFQN